jgi:hypothetical protein
VNSAAKYSPQWQERIGWKLFPASLCESPEVPGARDCIVIRTTGTLSVLGRLRALISGRVQVETRTVTEFKIGRVLTHSAVSVLPPVWLSRREKKGGAK